MWDHRHGIERAYLAALTVMLACIALVTVSIAAVALDLREELTHIRVTLDEAYEEGN